ncbi:MAG: hypothetical protein D6698_02205 [Gammaproteobacteria bacterium]|nr:MAG: hypothetical protein D6698_02205 [Gammaproteobacteria bacterium]
MTDLKTVTGWLLLAGWLLWALIMISWSGVATAEEGKNRISLGWMGFNDTATTSDVSFSGDGYSVPLSISRYQSGWQVGLSSAYLIQSDGVGRVSGPGDLRLSVGRDLNEDWTITYQHKFATADEAAGFSTGADDNDLAVDYFRFIGSRSSLITSLGYKWVGKGQRTDRQNGGYVSAGLSWLVLAGFNLTGSIDFNQSTYSTSPDVTTLTLFGSHQLRDGWSVGWFVSRDSDDIFAGGTNVSVAF